MNYTIEQFEKDFENAELDKQSLLLKLLDSNIDVVKNKERLQPYIQHIKELRTNISIQDDNEVNNLLEKGLVKTYKCLNSIENFIKDEQYQFYIKDFGTLLFFKIALQIYEALSEEECQFIDENFKYQFPKKDTFSLLYQIKEKNNLKKTVYVSLKSLDFNNNFILID